MKPTLEQWKRILSGVREFEEGEPFIAEDTAALGEFVADLETRLKGSWASGADIKNFWDNGWPDGCWYDDAEISVLDENENGNWVLDDNELYNLAKLGLVVSDNGNKTFEEVFLAWKATQP
jgi:hypothetical protein